MATLTGIVIGYIAVQTGSLWPCIVYHFGNNACAVLSSTVDEHLISAWPLLEWIFVPAEQGYAFHVWVAVAGGVCATLLLWWFARLPHRASREEELQEALDHQQAAAGA
jgi:sodium transport system permease protein